METVLITAGVACLIGAIVGGGLKAFEMEIPLLQSVRRQILLGALGSGLLALGLLTRSPGTGSAVADAGGPASSPAEYDERSGADTAGEDGEAAENEAGHSRNLNDAQAADIKSLRPDGRPYLNATQEAQFLLKALGYELLQDGYEGPATTVALEDFQRKQQLPVSGAADAATLGVLRVRASKAFLRPS